MRGFVINKFIICKNRRGIDIYLAVVVRPPMLGMGRPVVTVSNNICCGINNVCRSSLHIYHNIRLLFSLLVVETQLAPACFNTN